MAMKSNEEFLRELYMIHEGRITSLERYKGSKRKILFKCNVCGNEWKTSPGNIKKTKNCPKCALRKKAKKRTLTHKEFLEKAKKEMGQNFYNYEVLSRYKKRDQKIKVKHRECGYVWDITPANFYNVKTCPKCHGRVDGQMSKKQIKKNMKTDSEFRKELKHIWGSEYTPLECYKGYNRKVLVRHNKCKHEWEVVAGSLLQGHGCPKCAGNYQRTTREYQKELDEKFKGQLELISEFTNTKSDVVVKCNECREIFTRNANYLINITEAARCPICKPISAGEEVIRCFLRDHNIFYITQYPIKMDSQILVFDFAIYNKHTIAAFIEYQGIQHYHPVEYFGGEKAFKKQQKNDNKKRKYCKTNNISLIEVTYQENDIEGYLSRKLDRLNQSIQLSIL